MPATKPASRTRAKSPPCIVNKGGCCSHFRWTRYGFDRHVRDGLPVVAAAAHKGAEWRIDLLAVEIWLDERAAAAARWRKAREEQEAARQRETEATHEKLRKIGLGYLLDRARR